MNHRAAIAAGRRAVYIDPLNEASHRLLMGALEAGGQRAGAARQFRLCRETLKEELGIDPDPETRDLAERLFVGKRPSAEAVAPITQGPQSTAQHWPCVLPRFAVGVRPIINLTGDAAYEHLADAFTQDLITDVLRRNAGGFDIKWPPAHGEMRSRGATEWCDYVVAGSFQCSGPGVLRVNIRITDQVQSKYLWAGRHEVRPEELPLLQTRITARISRELCLVLLKMASQDEGPSVIDGAECLRKAQAALGKAEAGPESVIDAQRWFLAAVAADPHDVEALRGLAMSCRHLVDNPSWADARTRASASYLEGQLVHIGRALAPGIFRNQETAIERNARLWATVEMRA
jgi:TolB-like protein